MNLMINKQKLKEIMQFVISEYPNGCANHNWRRCYYISIVENKQEIEDFEIENIIEECMNEFIYEDLKLCGCGNPQDTYEVIRLILTAHNQEESEDKHKILNDICGINKSEHNNYHGLIQFASYILDSHDFLEHGSSISGAWLTEKGKLFLELLNMNHSISNNTNET